MAKVNVDFEDYEERAGYQGETPKPGLYTARLYSLQDHTAKSSGAEGFEWVFEIVGEPYAGFRGWVYSNMDTTKWRTQQVVKAITGGSTEKFVLDTDKADRIVAKAKQVKIRIKHEEYQGEQRARITAIIPIEGAAAGGASKPSKPAPANDPWDEDDEDDEG